MIKSYYKFIKNNKFLSFQPTKYKFTTQIIIKREGSDLYETFKDFYNEALINLEV